MAFIQQVKFANINAKQKDTRNQISNNIANLNAQAMIAIKQQVYLRLNPDNNIDPEYITLVGAEVAPIAAAFAEVKEKLDDITAVMTDTMTVEAMVTKYNIDIVQVSNELL